MHKFKEKGPSFLIIAVIYLIAFLTGILVYNSSLWNHMLVATLFANIAATLVVWFFGVILKNSSIYDPYWSIAPIIIILFWTSSQNTIFSLTGILFLAAVFIWGIRLTLNWAMRWNGLDHQDWRYSRLKRNNPRIWFLTNLFGINLMPTLIVFVALTPVYYSIGLKARFSIISFFGFALCITAVLIQSIADRQMDLFRDKRNSKNKYIDKGLWHYCRHPNYLGEVLFWWGIWLIQIGARPGIWITIIGPIIVTLLFIFISIPLMEKYISETKPGYHNYKKKVPMLLPGLGKQ
ncbi:MAG: DUF1295 domain-containing protein [Candidatus Humimicrobiaceae bacterium]